MGRAVVLGVLMAASLAALLQGAGAAGPNPNASYSYRMLNDPHTGEDVRFAGAFRGYAQDRSNALFNTLASLLGGNAPALNAVQTGSPLLSDGDASANVKDLPGAPLWTVNMSPLAYEALINDRSPWHNAGVGAMPHEFAHLRQTAQTLADLVQREGGAQAFSDLVTPEAAKRAHIPFVPGGLDGVYSDYVQQVQQRGRDWILGTQFGRVAPSAWP